MKHGFFPKRFFEKYSNTKCNENPSCGSRVFPCERADGQTYMTKLTVTFLNFAEVLSKEGKLPMLEGTVRWKKMRTNNNNNNKNNNKKINSSYTILFSVKLKSIMSVIRHVFLEGNVGILLDQNERCFWSSSSAPSTACRWASPQQ